MSNRGKTLRGKHLASPTIVGVGGAAGYRPPMSLSGIQLGIEQGADAIGLVVTASQDGVLVVTPELNLAESTDIGRQLWAASRFRNTTVAGRGMSGWFAEDFTAAELGMLTYSEPLGRLRAESQRHGNRDSVLTLAEALRIIHKLSSQVNVIIEFLEPTFVQRRGFDYATALKESLLEAGWSSSDQRLSLVSCEKSLLAVLRAAGLGSRHLYRCDFMGSAPDEIGKQDGERRPYLMELSREGIGALATQCDGLVLPISMIYTPVVVAGAIAASASLDRSLVGRAHDVGLHVHAFNLQGENRFRPSSLRKGVDPASFTGWEPYFEGVMATGVDGVFTDHPDLAIRAREALLG